MIRAFDSATVESLLHSYACRLVIFLYVVFFPGEELMILFVLRSEKTSFLNEI